MGNWYWRNAHMIISQWNAISQPARVWIHGIPCHPMPDAKMNATLNSNRITFGLNVHVVHAICMSAGYECTISPSPLSSAVMLVVYCVVLSYVYRIDTNADATFFQLNFFFSSFSFIKKKQMNEMSGGNPHKKEWFSTQKSELVVSLSLYMSQSTEMNWTDSLKFCILFINCTWKVPIDFVYIPHLAMVDSTIKLISLSY